MSDRIELGRLGRPHGVRGALWIWPHNEFSALLKVGRTIQVGADPEATRGYEIESVRREGSGFVVHLVGVADRDAAGSLNGMFWYEARADFPAPAADEYYHVDLVGLRAETDDGRELGRVAEVWEAPASVVLVIRGERELLVPFVEAYLAGVELANRRIVLRNVDALLDPVTDTGDA